jgi:hypothetical protein
MVFKQDARTREWHAQAVVRGQPVNLTIDGLHPTSEHERLATSAVTRVENAWGMIQQNVLSSLHPLYNKAWANSEQGCPPLSPEEFLKRIRLEGVDVLDEERALSLWFNDSNLFGGHMIHIFWNSNGKMYNASLEG